MIKRSNNPVGKTTANTIWNVSKLHFFSVKLVAKFSVNMILV